MKLIDAFIFQGEIDILKIRLEYLYPYVDIFLICESNITKKGEIKDYHYLKSESDFERWRDKIVFIKYEPNVSKIDLFAKGVDENGNYVQRQLESDHRNFLSTFLIQQSGDDFAIISNVDEIWHSRIAQYLRSGELGLDRARLAMEFHSHYLNCFGIGSANSTWALPYFSKIHLIQKDSDLSRTRVQVKMPPVEKAGWYFSCLCDAQKNYERNEILSPTENGDKKNLLTSIGLGIDHLGREDYAWAFRPVDFYPVELSRLMKLNPQYVKTDLIGVGESLIPTPKLKGMLALERMKSQKLEKQLDSLLIERDFIIKSLSWRLSRPFRELHRWIVNPKSQFFRFFADADNSHPIAKVFSNLLNPLQRRLSLRIDAAPSKQGKFYASEFGGDFKNLSTDRKIEFLKEEIKNKFTAVTSFTPTVSIIIPVYGKAEYTLCALVSILRHLPETSFEIIIVDDCSPDGSGKIFSEIQGIRYFLQERNMGFIRSCNYGAKHAHGQYLYFMNNDVEVTDNWLDELLATFDNLLDVGLVGSKLVYPDGTLQEAGGIVWSDASAWNFGRLQCQLDPTYNYARDVDYCSGASIMIRRDVFSRIGGFDEIYVPAYYEDVDLAFKVREIGKKVIYQPLSVVIHHEGISSGTDLAQGTKSFQEINKVKLFDRWQEKLSLHQLPGVDVDKAMDRSLHGRILVVDSNTPMPDRDAGSLLIFNLLILLKELGFTVTFVAGENFLFDMKYTPKLQRLGIEVLYGPETVDLESHLKNFGLRYSATILVRPEIAIRYLTDIRKYCPNIPIIYHTIDLHYLRMERQANLLNDDELLTSSQRMKRLEFDVIQASDASIVVSTVEKELLDLEKLDANIQIMPLILESQKNNHSFSDRKDIVFVGSFSHPPNLDAVLYFINAVMPILRSQIPGVVFNVIGSNPPDSLKKLGRDDIKILGFVENLDLFYSKVRLSVAPLRFGAGIKGKIASSMLAGVPVVCSSLACEGMELIDDKHIIVANSPEDYANKIVKLYSDEAQWHFIANSGFDYAKTKWGVKASIEILRSILESVGVDVKTPAHYQIPLFNEIERRLNQDKSKFILEPYASLHSQSEFNCLIEAEGIRVSLPDNEQHKKLSVDNSIGIKGFCVPCQIETLFKVDLLYGGEIREGVSYPNWRERLECESCGMNNRQRLVASLMKGYCCDKNISSIYMMEQVTPIFSWALRALKDVEIVGSEYLGHKFKGGEMVGAIRHEDIEGLSFADESFDLIVSNDVFEHVPNPENAFSECFRVLKKGGTMLATFPFYEDMKEVRKRAEIINNQVIEILPKQFHGNPVSSEGSLVFTDFGWDVLEMAKVQGFSSAKIELYASKENGHYGKSQYIFKFEK